MEHFPIEAWVDFVRLAGPEPRMLEMARHRAYCASCHRLALMVEDVAATVTLDEVFAPPDDVVDHAVQMFDRRHRSSTSSAPSMKKGFELRMSPRRPARSR